METDRNTMAGENSWLAQELIPAKSTVSEGQSITVRALLLKYRWITATILATMIVAMFAYRSLISNPPYSIEIRSVSLDGAVTYVPLRYEECDHTEEIAAIRKHTFNRIYHSVYYEGLQYGFSRSGHVYATEGTEVGGPSNLVRSWHWSGNPHQFPYFDFSHSWDPGRP